MTAPAESKTVECEDIVNTKNMKEASRLSCENCVEAEKTTIDSININVYINV